MPKFAANLSMMFTEHAFLDRFDAAAEAGFAAVEYLFPYDHSPADIAARLQRNNLTQALFNLPPGDFAAGERGLAALSGRGEELRASVDRALEYAAATGVKRLHMMAGLASSSDSRALVTYQGALELAARKFGDAGLDLLIEPINGRNMPGYFLDDFGLAEKIIADVGMANVKLQFDIYHRQIMHGDVTMALRRLMPITGHVQIASVPSRNEPDGEELNYPFLFDELDRLGYDGYVGCEYNPRGRTTDGLGWFKKFARS